MSRNRSLLESIFWRRKKTDFFIDLHLRDFHLFLTSLLLTIIINGMHFVQDFIPLIFYQIKTFSKPWLVLKLIYRGQSFQQVFSDSDAINYIDSWLQPLNIKELLLVSGNDDCVTINSWWKFHHTLFSQTFFTAQNDLSSLKFYDSCH